MSSLHPTLRNLVTNERGNVMITFGLTSMIMVAFVGGAIDFGRAYSQKSKMQNALDAAVVSGIAKYRETTDWTVAKAQAVSTFQAAFTGAVTPTASNPNPTAATDAPLVTFTQNGSTLSGTATMHVSAPFVGLATGAFSGNPLHINISVASDAVPPTGKQLEVAVMVDLTGSMGWDASAGANPTSCSIVSSPTKKIDYLKCAGEDLLNILLPASGVNNNSVKIGIAPFSDKVNAGPYASLVVDPVLYPATGGSYANISNLASTKQGQWTGGYSGANTTAATQPVGAQFGAMGASATPGATVTTSGATFTNSYCSVPTQTTTGLVALRTKNSYRVGVEIDRADDEYTNGFNPSLTIAGVITLGDNAPSADGFRKIIDIDGEGPDWIDVESSTDNKGYFVPLPENATGLTRRQRTADVSVSCGRRCSTTESKTGDIGAYVAVEESYDYDNLISYGFKKASSNAGYWRLKKITDPEGEEYEWKTSGWYLPLYTSLSATTTTTVPGCESTVAPQPSSYLITCVTERKNGSDLDYTADAIGTGRYVGPYNHGSTSKSNYSSNGKCYTSGRELPAVIPLSNDRTTLWSFFDTATVGGATAGHLGTAWASYLLSPNWSNIWPAGSTPVAYNTTTVSKAAILMTDGEYNIQFSTGGNSSNISAKQALMLCKEMRANNIKVYTVGFGFGEDATPPNPNIAGMSDADRTTPLSSGTAKERALDTLAKCASDNSSYYFPYDGDSLRQVFRSIANGLSADLAGGTARITN